MPDPYIIENLQPPVVITVDESVYTITGEVAGSPGVQGAQGSQGAQGATGAQGAQGATGAASTVVGPTGPQGAQGSQGSQGAVGSQGSVGAQGSQGAIGAQGSVGSQGHTGPQGVQGAQGLTGATGATGPQGSAGSQGAQGSVGAQGSQGPQGAVGAQGATGAQGAIGSQGATGPQGSVGAQGDTGAQGVQGAQGAQGATGASPTSLGLVTGSYYGSVIASATALQMVVNRTYYTSVYLSETTSFDRFAIRTSSFTGTAVVRLGLYNNSNGKPTTVVFDAGTVSCTTGSTTYTITISQTVSAGWYWLASNMQTAAASPFFVGGTTFIGLGIGQYPASGAVNSTTPCWTESSITGAFATAGTLVEANGATITALRKA